MNMCRLHILGHAASCDYNYAVYQSAAVMSVALSVGRARNAVRHRSHLIVSTHVAKVAARARRVGYESRSQFSREYTRLFGNPTVHHQGSFCEDKFHHFTLIALAL